MKHHLICLFFPSPARHVKSPFSVILDKIQFRIFTQTEASLKRATKTCDLFCDIAAKEVEKRCCPLYHPRIKPVNNWLVPSSYSAHFSAMLQDNFHFFCCSFFRTLCANGKLITFPNAWSDSSIWTRSDFNNFVSLGTGT